MKKTQRYISAPMFVEYYNKVAQNLNKGYRLHDQHTSIPGLKRSGIHPQIVHCSNSKEFLVYSEDDVIGYVKKIMNHELLPMRVRAACMNRALINCDYQHVENLFKESKNDGCTHKSFFKDTNAYVDDNASVMPCDPKKLEVVSTLEGMKNAAKGKHEQKYVIVSRDTISQVIKNMERAKYTLEEGIAKKIAA